MLHECEGRYGFAVVLVSAEQHGSRLKALQFSFFLLVVVSPSLLSVSLQERGEWRGCANVHIACNACKRIRRHSEDATMQCILCLEECVKYVAVPKKIANTKHLLRVGNPLQCV